MNLIITDRCNRNCPYCFARDKVSLQCGDAPAKVSAVSPDDVQTYLGFLEKSHIPNFKIMGGEPTLHPQFCEIVDAGLHHACHFNVIVFTNGLWPDRVKEYFRQQRTSSVQLVVNVNAPDAQAEWENALQREALSIAGSRACIGHNIYREDFDLLFATDLIETYKLKREIRLGLASPIVGCDNECLGEDSLEHVGRRLVGQLRQLEQADILCGFDCGFALCMFSEADLGALALCSLGLSWQCDVIIDVGPDLTAWPCFPLSRLLNVKLTDFPDAKALREHFVTRLSPLRSFGSMDKCLSCKYLRRRQCSGGCMARTLKRWQASGDEEIVEKINAIG